MDAEGWSAPAGQEGSGKKTPVVEPQVRRAQGGRKVTVAIWVFLAHTPMKTVWIIKEMYAKPISKGRECLYAMYGIDLKVYLFLRQRRIRNGN